MTLGRCAFILMSPILASGIAWSWTYQAVVKPFDLASFGGQNGYEIDLQRRFGQDEDRPHSVALSYQERTTQPRRYQTASVRSMLYLTKSFHFDVGLGLRQSETEESSPMRSDGATLDMSRRATAFGLELGAGNRWVLPFGLVIGATWLQLLVPAIKIEGNTNEGRRSTGSAFAFELGWST